MRLHCQRSRLRPAPTSADAPTLPAIATQASSHVGGCAYTASDRDSGQLPRRRMRLHCQRSLPRASSAALSSTEDLYILLHYLYITMGRSSLRRNQSRQTPYAVIDCTKRKKKIKKKKKRRQHTHSCLYIRKKNKEKIDGLYYHPVPYRRSSSEAARTTPTHQANLLSPPHRLCAPNIAHLLSSLSSRGSFCPLPSSQFWSLTHTTARLI
jgi:hypothetical protein